MLLIFLEEKFIREKFLILFPKKKAQKKTNFPKKPLVCILHSTWAIRLDFALASIALVNRGKTFLQVGLGWLNVFLFKNSFFPFLRQFPIFSQFLVRKSQFLFVGIFKMSRLVTSLFILLPVVCYGIISDNVTVRRNEILWFSSSKPNFWYFSSNSSKTYFSGHPRRWTRPSLPGGSQVSVRRRECCSILPLAWILVSFLDGHVSLPLLTKTYDFCALLLRFLTN